MRLVDADAMKKRLEEWNTSDPMDNTLYNFALNRIIEQPTIDPVRKGRKINQHSYPAKWLCSECGAKHFDFSDKFCSECGVNVEEGEQE